MIRLVIVFVPTNLKEYHCNIQIIFYLRSMKKKKTHKFLLRLDENHKKPLEKLAEANYSSLNGEINKAIEQHLSNNKEKTK